MLLLLCLIPNGINQLLVAIQIGLNAAQILLVVAGSLELTGIQVLVLWLAHGVLLHRLVGLQKLLSIQEPLTIHGLV